MSPPLHLQPRSLRGPPCLPWHTLLTKLLHFKVCLELLLGRTLVSGFDAPGPKTEAQRELGEMEPEKENLPPSTPRVPNRAPDELWEAEGVREDTVLGQEILADHSDPLRVLRGSGVVGSCPRPSACDITPVSGIRPPLRRGHLDVQSERPGHRIHPVVHSVYPVLNWRRENS